MIEALSEVDTIEQMDDIFAKKPLVGKYVSVTEDVTLNRKGRDETIERGRILKVIDQIRDGSGHHAVVVRTTEADPTQSALGRIFERTVQVVGTDDTEVWGLDGLR